MSVNVFSFASAPSSGDPEIVSRFFKFREKVFNQAQNYQMPSFEGMEHDELDTIGATYFARYGTHGAILGVSRLTPTKYQNYEQSMIANAIGKTVDGKVPHGERILEWSRLGVAPELSANPELRRTVVDEIVLSVLEVALAREAESMIAIMPPGFWNSVFVKRGWAVEPLGTGHQVYGPDPSRDFVTACQMPVSREILQNVRRVTGIAGPVTDYVPGYDMAGVKARRNDFDMAR